MRERRPTKDLIFFLGTDEFKLETKGYLELDTRDSKQEKYE